MRTLSYIKKCNRGWSLAARYKSVRALFAHRVVFYGRMWSSKHAPSNDIDMSLKALRLPVHNRCAYCFLLEDFASISPLRICIALWLVELHESCSSNVKASRNRVCPMSHIKKTKLFHIRRWKDLTPFVWSRVFLACPVISLIMLQDKIKVLVDITSRSNESCCLFDRIVINLDLRNPSLSTVSLSFYRLAQYFHNHYGWRFGNLISNVSSTLGLGKTMCLKWLEWSKCLEHDIVVLRYWWIDASNMVWREDISAVSCNYVQLLRAPKIFLVDNQCFGNTRRSWVYSYLLVGFLASDDSRRSFFTCNKTRVLFFFSLVNMSSQDILHATILIISVLFNNWWAHH